MFKNLVQNLVGSNAFGAGENFSKRVHPVADAWLSTSTSIPHLMSLVLLESRRMVRFDWTHSSGHNRTDT